MAILSRMTQGRFTTYRSYLTLTIASLWLSGCLFNPHNRPDGAPSRQVNVSKIANATPKPEAKSRYGNPASYVVRGKRYRVLPTALGYDVRGIASWYGTKFHGRLTSSREPYSMYKMTAASPVLPIPCYVRVTNLDNNKWVIVRVNDRGPFAPNRIIDLSYVAAQKLGMMKKGTALVQVQTLDGRHPLSPLMPHTPHLFLQLGAFGLKQNAIDLQKTIAATNQSTCAYSHEAK